MSVELMWVPDTALVDGRVSDEALAQMAEVFEFNRQIADLADAGHDPARVLASIIEELQVLRIQVRRSRLERAAGVRAAAARVRDAHDAWIDVSGMSSLAFGILLGVRQAVDGISTGLEGFAQEIERGERDGYSE